MKLLYHYPLADNSLRQWVCPVKKQIIIVNDENEPCDACNLPLDMEFEITDQCTCDLDDPDNTPACEFCEQKASKREQNYRRS
jgi:hypothetical protein